MSSVTHAINWAGGTAKDLAETLGVSEAAVSKWRRQGIPWDRCRQLEELSGGDLTCKQLRPDIFGPVLVDPDPSDNTVSPSPDKPAA